MFLKIIFGSVFLLIGDLKVIFWMYVIFIKVVVDVWVYYDIWYRDVVVWFINLGWMMGFWFIYVVFLNWVLIVFYNGVLFGYGFVKFV